MTKSYQMYIAGAFSGAEDGQRFAWVNPATDEFFTSFPKASAADEDRVVRAGNKAIHEFGQSEAIFCGHFRFPGRGSFRHEVRRS